MDLLARLKVVTMTIRHLDMSKFKDSMKYYTSEPILKPRRTFV